MNINDYKFKVGDKVVTTEGVVGKITQICNCHMCVERGFYEPFWEKEDGSYGNYISKITAEIGFNGYYQIGEYRFNDFDKGEVLRCMASCEDELKQLRKQLKVIEDLENEEGAYEDFKND